MEIKDIKIIIILVCLVFSSKVSFTQNILQEDSLIKNHFALNSNSFNTKDSGDRNSLSYFLVKSNGENSFAFKRKYKKNIERQISANWYIIKNSFSVIRKDQLIENWYPASNNRKLSDAFFYKKFFQKDSIYTFIIKVKDSLLFIKDIAGYHNNLHIQSSYHSVFLTGKTFLSLVLDSLIKNENVLSVDLRSNLPQVEASINDYDNSVNEINLFFSEYPNLIGDKLTASIKEKLFDTTDIDFKNRYVRTGISANDITSHATTMATIIGGGGNSFQTGKGVAWGCSLASSDFANLLPDENNIYRNYNISVQNNSYGVGIENFYGSDAAAYDQNAIDNPFLSEIFSAGNSGNLAAGDGRYKNFTGFANITGSFKQAKNILVVGSIDSFYNVAGLSSKGPAYDGRIKPELVAYGNEGSSGAAAITSGAALAVQAAYRSLHHDSLPENVLVKALLVNSADDVFNPGPDFYSGYGNVNVYEAVKDVFSNNIFSSDIFQDRVKDYTIHVPSNLKDLKISLAWNDPPAAANTLTALVNDLDLSLENKSEQATWLPWVLNSEEDSAKLLNNAVRKKDSLNNLEQITLTNPAGGDYIIHVKGYDLSTASQGYYIVYRFDTLDKFKFVSPVSNTHFTPAGNAIFRWNNSYTTPTGKLEYSVDKGNTWKVINNAVSLSQKYFYWTAPDTNAIAIARMTINNDIYISDTFDISAQIYPSIGFNCMDSFQINWSPKAGISQYQLYILGDKYLEPFTVVNDTSLIIRNSISDYIAVAPLLISNRTGIKSYTLNYKSQGVGCYISNFLADADGDNASLKLSLGTTYNISNIQFQKLSNGVWNNISEVNVVNTTDVFYSTPLLQGINYYRAVVTLDNGSSITSNAANVYYFKNQDYIIVPNPVERLQGFSVLSGNVSSNTLILFDVTGRKILQQTISQQNQNISTQKIANGFYIVTIFDNDNKLVYTTKIIIK